MVIIYFFIALLIFFILFEWPFFGLSIMVVMIPGEELTTLSGGRTLIWIFGVILLIAWTVRTLFTKKKIEGELKQSIIAIIFLLWCFISIFWTVDQKAALERGIIIAQLIVFFFLIQTLVINENKFKSILFLYYFSSIIIALISIYLTLYSNLSRAAITEDQNPNSLARVLGIALLMGIFIYKNINYKSKKMLFIFFQCLLIFAIFLTGSRGSWLSLLAAFCFTWVLVGKKLIKLRAVILIALIAFISIIIVNELSKKDVINIEIINRLTSMFDIEATHGGAGRINIWAVGWEIIKENPFIGVGLEGFTHVFHYYIYRANLFDTHGIYPGRDPHNIFLSIQAELGLVGSLLFLIFLIKFFLRLIKARYDLRAILGLLLLSFMVFSGIVEPVLYRKYFWLSLGLVAAIPKLISQDEM